jgi:nicotinamide riboside kinase
MKVINLFGSPGAGKSTAAMGLIHEMKKRYHQAEYVSEFAKDLFWSGNQHLMVQQNLVLAEQAWRQERLRQHAVEFAVTDSPLMLSSYYGQRYRPDLPPCFHEWVRYSFEQFDNVNFFILRKHPYESAGRIQDERESDQISQDMKAFLVSNNIPYQEVEAGDELPLQILSHLNLDWVNHPDRSGN